MQTNVSMLLREFPKIRRAAFRGERVVIATREGNLVLTAETPPGSTILGALKGQVHVQPGVNLAAPISDDAEWMR